MRSTLAHPIADSSYGEMAISLRTNTSLLGIDDRVLGGRVCVRVYPAAIEARISGLASTAPELRDVVVGAVSAIVVCIDVSTITQMNSARLR